MSEAEKPSSERFVTRAELEVILDLVAPRVLATSFDGPSQLARDRREWADRALARLRGA